MWRRSDADPTGPIVRTTIHKARTALVALEQRRKKMRQPPRHVEDPVTSIVALLVWTVFGSLGLLVLALALALGF
jgi:hypothetical protein